MNDGFGPGQASDNWPVTFGFANWVAGRESYAGSLDNTNSGLLVNAQYTQLAPYVSSPGVYRCPADLSRSNGSTGNPRVRNYSMSQAVGCTSPVATPPFGQSPQGNLAATSAGCWRTLADNYSKENQVVAPAFADLWVLVEEDPDSIDDGGFAFYMPASDSSSPHGIISRPICTAGTARACPSRTDIRKSTSGSGQSKSKRLIILLTTPTPSAM